MQKNIHYKEGIYEDDADEPDFSTEKSKRLRLEILAHKQSMTDSVEKLDANLQNVLEKHEYEYMQAYNIYVSHKEAELKQLIDKITERTCDKQANEKKM